MTDFDRKLYAQQQRHACSPLECTGAQGCWVELGTADALSNRIQGTPRCAACQGKVRIDNWRTPQGLGLSPHGRLNPRAVETKRARPREPASALG